MEVGLIHVSRPFSPFFTFKPSFYIFPQLLKCRKTKKIKEIIIKGFQTIVFIFIVISKTFLVQSAGAVEYTDCTSADPPPNECPGYDTKQSDGEVPAELEVWGMRSTPSLPSLPGPLLPGVVAPDIALSMG